MTILNKYKDQITRSLIENNEQELSLKPIQAPQQAPLVSPTQDVGLVPFDVPQAQKSVIEPIKAVQPPVTSVSPREDFTQGFTAPVLEPIKPTQPIQPVKTPVEAQAFAPGSEMNVEPQLKELKGAIDTWDEATYLLERSGNTIGTLVNKIPQLLGSIGLRADQKPSTTPEDQLAKLKALGINTDTLPKDYVDQITKTTNLPQTEQFWRDVITFDVVKDRAQEIEQKYEGKIDDFTKLAGDVSSGALDMLPQTGIAFLSGGTSAMAFVFADSASRATKEAVKLGAGAEDAQTYGLLMGAIETGTEMLAGGWAGVPKGKFTGLARVGLLGALEDATLKLAKSDLGKKAVKMAYQYLGEGAEEYLSEVLGNYANAVIGQDVQSLADIQDEALYSGLVGTLTAVVSELGRVGSVKLAEKVTQDNVKKVEELTKSQQLKYAKDLMAKTGANIIVADTFNGQDLTGSSGAYDPQTKTVIIPSEVYDNENILTLSAVHEFTHSLETSGQYEQLKTDVVNFMKKNGTYEATLADVINRYGEKVNADREIVADFLQDTLFKRVKRSDQGFETFTDATVLNAFLKGSKSKNVLEKVFNAYLQSHYAGELTEKHDALLKEYRQAMKKNDLEAIEKLQPEIEKVFKQKELTDKAGFFKGLELSFNSAIDYVDQVEAEQGLQFKKDDILAEGKTETEIREILQQEGKTDVEIESEIGQLKQDLAIEADLMPEQKLPEPQKKARKLTKTIEQNITLTEPTEIEVDKLRQSGALNYYTKADKTAILAAERMIGDDPKGYYEMFKGLFDRNQRITKEQFVAAQVLVQNYGTGKTKLEARKAADLIAMTAALATEYGQFIQAASVIKKLGTSGRVLYWDRVSKRLSKYYKEDLKLDVPAKLREEMLALDQNDKAGMKAVDEKIADHIASQLPSSWFEKFRAWQFFAMLSSPVTDIRNTIGNAVFAGINEMKDAIGTVGEQFVPKEERTKAFGQVSKENGQFAKQLYHDNKDVALSGGFYDMSRGLEQRKKIYNNKILEWAREKRFGLLEVEDAWFKQVAFRRAVSQMMTARGWTPETLTAEQMDKLLLHGAQVAQKRTFQQANAVSKSLNDLEKKNKIAGVAVQSLVPFKKTPINILKSGAEFSPIGLISGMTKGVYDVKQGKITPNEFVDRISAGLTGTGIAMVGYLAYLMGVITPGHDDDENKKLSSLNRSLGAQDYSIKIGDKHYSIDWLAPAIMPFMMGAELARALDRETDGNFEDKSMEIALRVFDPAFELSMLKGINDALASYEDGLGGQISSMLSTMAQNYALQIFPSALQKLNQIVDPTIRTTYTDKGFFEETFLKMTNKLPILSQLFNEPSIDIKGDVKKRSGDVWMRSINALLNPSYITEDISSPVDDEVKRLYQSVGESTVIPSLAPSSLTYHDATYQFTPEEKTAYAQVLGNTTYNLLELVIKDSNYTSLNDDTKADVLAGVYDYARSVAKDTYFTSIGETYADATYSKINEAMKNGIEVAEYLIMKNRFDTIKSTEDFGKKENIIADLVYRGYDDEKIASYLMYILGYSYTSSDQKYIDALRAR